MNADEPSPPLPDYGSETPPPDAPQPETAARWEDYVDVFLSPAALFRRRAGDRVAPPLITLLLAALVLYYLLLPANRIVMLASVADNPQALDALERFGIVMQIIGSIFVPITYAFVVLWTAALLWLVGRLTEIRTEFSRTTLIAVYAGFIMLLSQLVIGVLVLIHGEAGLDPVRHLSTGVLRFVGDADMNRAVMALLRRIDIFAIWQAVIWAIGIRVIYRTTALHAALVAFGVWLLGAVPGVIAGALGIGGGPG